MTGARRFATVLLCVAVLGGGAAASAEPRTGHGGPKTDAALTLVLMDGATEAHHMARVTFDFTAPKVDLPTVGLRCWQGVEFVYDGYVGYYAGYWFDPWFVLDSDYWVDGIPAACTARLFSYDRRGRERVLATLDFPVAP
jgi:hypothetical protein